MVTAPNVVGMTQTAATSTLAGLGLVLGTVTMQSSVTIPTGTVISQSVAPGIIVSPGTAINIAVSSGAVPVPNVVGLNQSAAATALAAAGLTLGSITPASSTTVAAGTVLGQNPAAATMTVAGSSVTLTVSVGPPSSHAYVGGNGSIAEFSINAQGRLMPLAGSPFAVPGSGQLYETKIDPSGHFLYAMNVSPGGGVYAFSISQSEGTLTPLNGGAPYSIGSAAQSLAFDAAGAFLYVLSLEGNSISTLSLDQSTGALTLLGQVAINQPNSEPQRLVRAGNYLYVAEYATNSVEVFAITPGTGALTEGVSGSPFATDSKPFSLAANPAGTVLYTANLGPSDYGTVSAFTINSGSGVLTQASALPLNIPAYHQLSIDPQGKFLFVTENNAVAVYPINASSAMLGAPVAATPFAAGSLPYAVSVDISDQYAYIANSGWGNVSEYTLDINTGALTLIEPVAANDTPIFVAIF